MSFLHHATWSVEFCAGHRLPLHTGKCKNYHGHTFTAHFVMRANTLNEQGFVIDFSSAKAITKSWIDEHWDHGFLLHESDRAINFLTEYQSKVYVLPCFPTMENLSAYLFEKFRRTFDLMPPSSSMGVLQSVRLYESPSTYAAYGELS